MTFASQVESFGSRKTWQEKNMTEKPKVEIAKSFVAEFLLAAGTGVAIALVIHSFVKYGRADGKSD